MLQLSPEGQNIINDIAQRHGFSVEAVLSMLQSVINGNGSMAQFNHFEFAGSGQWMNGGMTMVSDMFNNQLKNRVNALCSELARLVANQPDLVRTGSFQSQNQGGQQQNNFSTSQFQNNNAPMTPMTPMAPMAPMNSGASLFVPGQSNDWWPSDLRWPNSTGAQNGARYAYFAQARRLAIEVHGKVTVYDTLDHQIGGFSQQQSSSGSMSFNSQYGLIDVNTLPVISVDGVAVHPQQNHNTNHQAAPASAPPQQLAQQNNHQHPPHNQAPNQVQNPPQPAHGGSGKESDIFALIEKLADLRSRDVLSEEEYVTKKTELLARL